MAALGYLLAALLFLGARKAGYSQLLHTISELGEVGARDQRLVAFGLFLPIGLAFALLGFVLRGQAPASALACCIGAGYVIAAFFPCDPGSPVSGTPRQAVHNLGGAAEYIGGGMSLMLLGERVAPAFRICGFIVLGTAVILTVLPLGTPRGLVQRFAEVVLFGCAFWAAWLAAGGM